MLPRRVLVDPTHDTPDPEGYQNKSRKSRGTTSGTSSANTPGTFAHLSLCSTRAATLSHHLVSMAPGYWMKFTLRNLLGFGSMLTGGALVHSRFGPDLASGARHPGSPRAEPHVRSLTCARSPQTLPPLQDASPANAPTAAPTTAPPDGFEAAAKFQGARKGFVFKSGEAGLGATAHPRRGRPEAGQPARVTVAFHTQAIIRTEERSELSDRSRSATRL